MVGPFGGITAAQALQAVLIHPERLGEPVAFTGNFAAALADGPFTVEAAPARTNRSTQHWIVTVHQPDAAGTDAVVFTATVVTAVRRTTWGATDRTMPAVPAVDEVPSAPRSARVAWFGRYDMRFSKARCRVTGTAPKRPAARPACGCATSRRARWTTPA
jgi:hypothetical protein